MDYHSSDVGVLEAFAALAISNDRGVLRFSQRFGALDLCVHHLAPGHGPLMLPLKPLSKLERDRIWNWRCWDRPAVQPVDAYLRYGTRVATALQVAAALHRSRVPREQDVALLHAVWSEEAPDLDRELQFMRLRARSEDRPPSPVELARRVVGLEVDRWLDVAGVRAKFSWGWYSSDPRIELGGHGLWGVIARQLAFAVGRERPFVRCSGCGEWFYPHRSPRRGLQAWCGQAGCERERVKRAVRASRARSTRKKPRRAG
jgi:hypothetical protein